MSNVYISPEGEHDYNKKYEQYSIVTHTQGDIVTAYLAIKPVPPFISITDKNFWKLLNSGTDASVDISGKADKVNTPQIYEIPVGEILPLEIGDNCKPGDIFNRNTVSQHNNKIVGIVNSKYTLNGYEWIVVFSSPSGNSYNVGIIDYTVYRKNNNQWKLYTYTRYNLYDFAVEVKKATSQPQNGMLSNTLYNLGELSTNTTFTLAAATDNNIVNVWTWTFSTGSTAPTITWPAEITMWSDGEAPEIEANKYYEVSVMNGVGTVISADIPQTEVEP